MAKFFEGQELTYLRLTADGTESISVGKNANYHAFSIVVEFEDGPMSKIPWAIVTYHSGRVEKYNLSTVCGVGIK